MAAKPVVFLDLNIVLDVLQKREPFFPSSAALLSLAETGEIHAFLAAHSVTTLFYLVQKGRSSAEARAVITSLLQFLCIAPVTQTTIEQALSLDTPDFEDAVQMIAALQVKADCLVTRNPRDFEPALLPVFQPVEFLGTI
jgi:predicted nucleic acid-binding protein